MLSEVWMYQIALVYTLILTQAVTTGAVETVHKREDSTNGVNAQDASELLETYRSRSRGALLSMHHDHQRQRIYVGGINTLLALDARNVTNVIAQIDWSPSRSHSETCTKFKGNPALCQNAIRVLVSVNSTHLYTCGTMAYSPMCCYVLKEIFVILPGTIERGTWKSPHNPHASVISKITNNLLFTATKSSQRGNDGIISKALNGVNVRTREGDKYWLNDPDFVNMFHARQADTRQDKMLLFLREKAEEFRPFDFGMSRDRNERNVVSRVTSICVNDHGGTPWLMSGQFATYSKMTITCASSADAGRSPFRYDFVESTFEVFDENQPRNPTIYALFAMPSDAAAGIAICTYKMQDIVNRMQKNSFYWNRAGADTIKTTYDVNVRPPPDTCVDDTRRLSQNRLMFTKMHPIKFGTIFPSPGGIFYKESGQRYRHLVVHQMASALSGLAHNVTVLYMVSESGLLKRVVVSTVNEQISWALPDLSLINANDSAAVDKVILSEQELFVQTNASVIRLPMASCSVYGDCERCVNAQDPYCVWNEEVGSCASVFGLSESEKEVCFKSRRSASGAAACRNQPAPVQSDPDKQLIAELRANLSAANAREVAQEQQIAGLHGRQTALKRGLERCRNVSEDFDRTVGDLTLRLKAKQNAVDLAMLKIEGMRSQISTSRQRERWAIAKANDAWRKLNSVDSKTSATESTVRRLQMENHDMQLELFRCSETLRNFSKAGERMALEARINSEKLTRLEKRCATEKEKEVTVLRDEIGDLRNTTQDLRARLVELRTSSKCKSTNMTDKAARCFAKVNAVIQDVAVLMEVNRNLSRDLGNLEFQHQRNLQYIRRLTWLHRVNGQRGQQKCDYNGWFLSNVTGTLIQLADEKFSFRQARQYCHRQGGALAILKNREELRYINNVLRAFGRQQTYWIGLIKLKNGTLLWRDRTKLASGDLERFPRSQEARLKRNNVYCVEVTSQGRWNLIPCQRKRRPLCQKRAASTSFNTPPDHRFFQILEKST